MNQTEEAQVPAREERALLWALAVGMMVGAALVAGVASMAYGLRASV